LFFLCARNALPTPPTPPEHHGRPGRPPESELERSLARMWIEALDVTSVGAEEGFFELGGNSLIAMRMVARLEDTYGVEIPLARFLEHPTIAELARLLERTAAAPPPEALDRPTLSAHGDPTEPFPLTDIQEAYWVGRRPGVPGGAVGIHNYVELEVEDLAVGRLEDALRRLIGRHAMLRAVVDEQGRQRVLPTVPPLCLPVCDLRALPEASRERVLQSVRRAMSHRLFDPSRWPLFDIRIHRRAGDRARLHVSCDLLMADAASFQILQDELLRLYADPATPLKPIETSFRDYVLESRAREAGSVYRRARDYWLDRLDDLPPPLRLPWSNSAPPAAHRRFARLEAVLAAPAWRRLQDRGARFGLTPSGLLCAAFAEVLAHWSESPRFCLNVTTFNRRPLHPHVDRLVGDFTTTTLLEVAGSGTSFAARATALQRQLWNDLGHRAFSGIRVQRERNRRRGTITADMAPVVFTSTLGYRDSASGASAPALRGEVVHAISQTPQVLLDHQVFEFDGQLLFNWDHDVHRLPEGLVEAMFMAYRRLLKRLEAEEASWTRRSR